MRLHLALSAGLLGIFFSAQGCSVEPTGSERTDEETAQSEDEIINGSLDTTNRAVVWLFDENSGSSCTGTIIHVNGSTGYVLTAAHCNNMDYAIIANNYNDCFGQGNPGCEAVFQVAEQIYHPSYNPNDVGGGFDFSLIRFTGANGSTPVIPAATSPDGVATNAQVEIVGYGQIEGAGDNSRRRHKTTPITQVFGSSLFRTSSTLCFGDSGGPALLGGKVVGVSSFVDDDACLASGYSGRVATVYSNFIAPFIGGATPPPTCQSCFDDSTLAGGSCASQYNTCVNDQGCIDFANCVQPCGTNACVDNCTAQNPNGADLYFAIINCACGVCESLCPECAPPGTSSSGAGGGNTGSGGSSGTGVTSDDEFVWYPGKQSNETTVTTCSMGVGESSPSQAAWLLTGLAALVWRSRRRRSN